MVLPDAVHAVNMACDELSGNVAAYFEPDDDDDTSSASTSPPAGRLSLTDEPSGHGGSGTVVLTPCNPLAVLTDALGDWTAQAVNIGDATGMAAVTSNQMPCLAKLQRERQGLSGRQCGSHCKAMSACVSAAGAVEGLAQGVGDLGDSAAQQLGSAAGGLAQTGVGQLVSAGIQDIQQSPAAQTVSGIFRG